MQRYDKIIEKLQNCFEMSWARSGRARTESGNHKPVRLPLETTAVVNIVDRLEWNGADVRCYIDTRIPIASMSKLACTTNDITENERHIPWMTLLRATTLQTQSQVLLFSFRYNFFPHSLPSSSNFSSHSFVFFFFFSFFYFVVDALVVMSFVSTRWSCMSVVDRYIVFWSCLLLLYIRQNAPMMVAAAVAVERGWEDD